MSPIPVIFLDRHSVFRRLVSRVLERHFGDEILLLADGDSWPLAEPLPTQPKAVLLGLGSDGLVDPLLLASINATLAGVPVIVLAHLYDEAYHEAALEAGADAFIAKVTLDTELVPVLHRLTSQVPDPA